MRYEDVYRRSVDEPEAFWGEEAQRIYWHTPPQQILDYSNPPFRRWFVGGETNLCYNAVDRHLVDRPDQLALVAVSSETGVTREITYRELHREVNAFAAVLLRLDVQRGDRVQHRHVARRTERALGVGDEAVAHDGLVGELVVCRVRVAAYVQIFRDSEHVLDVVVDLGTLDTRVLRRGGGAGTFAGKRGRHGSG